METALPFERVALRKLWWVTPLTIVFAIIANLILRAIAISLFGVPETFQFLQAPSIIGSTIVFVLVALVVFILVGRRARRPMRVYRVLALVALCLSLLSPIMALTGGLPAPGMNLPIFWTMILMHIVTAAIVIILFTTLARKR